MKFIPSLQSVSPFTFFKPAKRKNSQHFPFNAERKHYFYFARNGIYHLGKRLQELGYGQILFPAYNHGNEIRALEASGVKLTYYNVKSDTQVDLDDLKEQIKQSAIKVVYFIHYVGVSQNIKPLLELKRKYNLILIEDNALGLFSKNSEGDLGSFGDAAIFCLYKTLPIPNGGLLTINNPQLELAVNSERPQLLSTISRLGGQIFFWLDLHFGGLGRRLQKMKTSLGSVMDKHSTIERVPVLDSNFDTSRVNWSTSDIAHYLRRRADFEKIVAKRQENFRYLQSKIDKKYYLFSDLPEGASPWFFPAIVENREEVFTKLTAAGVDCARFWRHWYPGIPKEKFPHVTFLRERILELPIHQDLNKKHLDFVADEFNKWAN